MQDKRNAMLSLVFGIAICLVFQITSISAQNQAESKEKKDTQSIILASAEACLKVKTIEYTFEQKTVTYNGLGIGLSHIIANVKQERADVPQSRFFGKYQASGKLTLSDSAPKRLYELLGLKDGQKTADFSYGYDGKQFEFLSPPSQSVLVVKPLSTQTIGKLSDNSGANTVIISDFSHPEPLKRVLDGNADFKYLGTQEIEGVICHAISFNRIITPPTLPDQTVTIRNLIYIGVDDLLPRRYVTSSIERTIRIKKVNQPIETEAFKVSLPSGYSLRLVNEQDTIGLETSGLLENGTTAPDWKLNDPEGKTHSLNDYRGKVVVMDFWATWCGPCIASMPAIQSLHKKYEKKGAVVLGISCKEEKSSDAVEFFRKKGYDYRLLLNGEYIVSNYRAEALPTLYVIGKEGQIIYAKRGYNLLEKGDVGEI